MQRFSIDCNPKSQNIVFQNNDLRISLLTPRLIRLEQEYFTDLPTQTVWNRSLGEVSFEKKLLGNQLTVITEDAQFSIDFKHGKLTKIILHDGECVTDFVRGILPGTARTLDMANGATKLEPGILSRSGAALMDDSNSLLLKDGRILPRPKCSDRYYFAYGHDYLGQLRDFYRLTGPVPLIPKYALGNWWSRYKAYTQEEYRSLMQKFMDRQIPITVATIDMDWHWVDVLERFGQEAMPEKPKCKEEILYNLKMPGWTGYTWNDELFPDHRELLRWLHDHKFHVTLNVHPSQGIRYYEDCYPSICKQMGRDPETKELIPFDITDPLFLEAYFDKAHHPHEEDGVDFWWLDWQQGKNTKIPGLDPLWALNHYHTLDRSRNNGRSLILSRYAGLGSHRYPLGFSGDTICTWKSLAFQPYFTFTASNAGYSWWSHDIGGHMMGIQDDELYLRWLQFGVFSPINRLHSSNSPFMGKEPWLRSWAVAQISENFLRLRHRLIPYLYSANYKTHTLGTPLCMPMYYKWDCQEAYECNSQYIFGEQLLVCPITSPCDKRLNLAKANVWLPEGRWTDIFNGRIYNGGQWVAMHRDLDSIPVLAAAGAIVPMYQKGESNDLSLDQPLEIHIWRGNGRYELYEDDGESMNYAKGQGATTVFELTEDEDQLTLKITPPLDNHGLWKGERTMQLLFRDVVSAEAYCNDESISFADRIPVEVGYNPVTIQLKNVAAAKNPNIDEIRIGLFTRIQSTNGWKHKHLQNKETMPDFVLDALRELDAMQ